MKSIINRISKLFRSFKLVPRPRGGFRFRDLVPFAIVLPVIVYVLLSQSITASETILNTRKVSKQTAGANGVFASLPVADIRGKQAGVLVNVASRAKLLANMRAARRMSIALMVFCMIFGVAGTLYIRTRDLALRANRDELTGLYNHGYMQEFIKAELVRSARYDRNISVLMLDIDHFKVVNDTYGHGVGDQVLKSIAETVVGNFRETDLVARYGGEEMIIILPETETLRAISSADRLREAIQNHTIRARMTKDHAGDSVDVNVTVSIGIATYPLDGQNAKELIDAADTALATAKKERNVVTSYGDIVENSSAGGKLTSKLDGFLRDSSISTVRPLVAAIDTRDPGAAHHSEKVAEYAIAIGRELGFSTQDLSVTCKAALVHDVGKIGIPDAIFTKQGRLTADEVAAVRRHTQIGADIVKNSPHLATVADIVLRHHERYDGTGYPDGQSGECIPLIARVLFVADVMDAMTSQRSYRQTVGFAEVLKELKAESGRQFDPMVVAAAERVIEKMMGSKRERRAA